MVIKKKAIGQCFYLSVANSQDLAIRDERLQKLMILLPASQPKGKHFRDAHFPQRVPALARQDNYLRP